MLFGSKIVSCSQEETFGSLISMNSSQLHLVAMLVVFSVHFSTLVSENCFLPATWVSFVIKLARATEYQGLIIMDFIWEVQGFLALCLGSLCMDWLCHFWYLISKLNSCHSERAWLLVGQSEELKL